MIYDIGSIITKFYIWTLIFFILLILVFVYGYKRRKN